MVNLIIKSKIKEAVEDMNISSEVAEELNKKTLHILEEAAWRAKENNRKTIQARDL